MDGSASVGALRLTVVLDQFPELSETFISSELQELRRLGHAVTVEAAKRAAHPNAGAALGLAVAYLEDDSRGARLRSIAWLAARHPVRCVRDLVTRPRWRREEPVRPLRQLAPAARRAAAAGSTHLHAHFAAGAALDAMRLGWVLGLPYSLASHGYDIFQAPANIAEKHERAAFAVSDCEYSVRHLRGVVDAGAAARLQRLVLGIDGERFSRNGGDRSGGYVLAVARLVEKKGLRHLVEAAALLRDRGGGVEALVRIVGEGPLRAEIEALIAELEVGDRVELLGERDPDQVRDLLEHAALLAMPCVVAADGDRDTMPVVVKEALAMEVPVVATDEVGLPEVVRPGWGRLVPPRDSAALADALGELLALSPEERARMGRAGRAFVLEHCSLTRETERLVRLVSEAAAGP